MNIVKTLYSDLLWQRSLINESNDEKYCETNINIQTSCKINELVRNFSVSLTEEIYFHN